MSWFVLLTHRAAWLFSKFGLSADDFEMLLQDEDFFLCEAAWDVEDAIIDGAFDHHIRNDSTIDKNDRRASLLLHCELLELMGSMGIEAEIGSDLTVIPWKWQEGLNVAFTHHWNVAYKNFYLRVAELNFAGERWPIGRFTLAMKADGH